MEQSTESFPKNEVDDEDDDDYKDEEMNKRVKEILEMYKRIELIQTLILNEDSAIKEILKEYIEKRKHKGKLLEEN